MQKIKNKVFEKWLEKKLSKLEVLFLIVIARYQDNTGLVRGVYYKDICKELGLLTGKRRAYSSYYLILDALEQKGLIEVERGFKDRNIRICENDFTDGNYHEGYISVRHGLFYSQDFGRLKANEMLLCMEFLKNCESSQNDGRKMDMHIGVKTLFDKYTKKLQVTERVIRGYLTNLKTFFSIYIRDRMYWIEMLKHTGKKLPENKEDYQYRKNVAKSILRKNRMKETPEQLEMIMQLMKQHGKRLRDDVADAVAISVQKSLQYVNDKVINPYKWDRTLRPKLLQKIIKGNGEVPLPSFL
ncbi:hypothetical protein [Anaeromicropila populeti]|uniref:Uncharacterized protein n=1 Tax=Anaeromicropila populeti TaxID=37658 RepID=A0A1I6LX00_9FIRM|nr:hypothetical protein [Anaeromicropila populeti]SFS07812.1 hypothetical protein SAMN05661086_03619 [Anaeromicropila populeti]